MEQFGKYSLIRKIGTGGMAEVFLARTTVAQGLNKTLVIKKIHTAYARSRQFVTMFVDEAKIALGLNHPNIIQVFDFGAVGDTYFLAMEYVEGIDLLKLLQEAAKARFTQQKAQIEADTAIIKAKGEAEAIRVRAEAIKDNPGLIQLQIVEKWDGRSPLVVGGGEGGGANILLPLGAAAAARASESK